MPSAEYRSPALGDSKPKRAASREAGPRQALPPTDGTRLYRRRRDSNPLNLPRDLAPPGYTYEWKREGVYGWNDVNNQKEMRENHWAYVPASRHPELATPGETVIRDSGGLALMERPTYLCDEAGMEDIMAGMAPLQRQEEIMYGTKPGEMTRNHPSVRNWSRMREEKSPGAPTTFGEPPEGMYSEP